MAADMSGQTLNGNYASQPSYESSEPVVAAGSHGNTMAVSNGPPAPAVGSSAGAGSQNPPSKDEVGWYFVEQYYTTLSRNPEKLHVGPSGSKLYLKSFLTVFSSSMPNDPSFSVVLRPRKSLYLSVNV